MATFNEFQRELQKRGIDGRNAYMFTLVYERLIETEKLVNQAMTVISGFATLLQGFTALREEDMRAMQDLKRKTDGVDVMSVANEPEGN